MIIDELIFFIIVVSMAIFVESEEGWTEDRTFFIIYIITAHTMILGLIVTIDVIIAIIRAICKKIA
jgi:hypothetical protein